MNAVAAAFEHELVAYMPQITGALVALLLALIVWIRKFLGDVRAEMTASAVRQALDAHGDSDQADAAAHAELHRVPKRMRPKDVAGAVQRAIEDERAARVIERLEG